METGKKYKLTDKCITPGGRNMTRDEIEKFSSVRLDCFETDREERWYEIGCIDGLKAANAEPNLESLWHDTNIVPSENKGIIYLTKNNKLGVINPIKSNNWDWYVAVKYSIIKWAYLSDLLPKGGER